MVATALMGMVLVVLLQVLSASWRAQEASTAQTRALMVAERVLGEYLGARQLKEGAFGGQEGPFAYRVRLSRQFSVSHPSLGERAACYLIQVTVLWEERGRTKSTGLETMRAVGPKGT